MVFTTQLTNKILQISCLWIGYTQRRSDSLKRIKRSVKAERLSQKYSNKIKVFFNNDVLAFLGVK